MRKIVNIYIILFIVEGIVSLVNAMTGRLLGIQPLSIFQGMIAPIVFVLSFALYFIMGGTRGFPKRFLLPMILISIWAGLFFALPVPMYLGIHNTELLLSIVQPCLAIGAIVILRRSSDNKYWLYDRSAFEQFVFRWKRFFGFAVVNVIVIIPLIGVYLVLSVGAGISHLSHGFVHLGFRGISVEARTYLYEGKNVILLPTAHIAQAGFYDELVASLPVENTLVIPEGVTDKEKLLKDGLGYSKLASSLDLEAQNNQSIVADRDKKFCDVDISDFSKETIACLRSVAGVLQQWSRGNREMALLQMVSIQEPDSKLLLRDVLELRNQRVNQCISDYLQAYDNIVVPWGAAHMPGIERNILASGGTITERRIIQLLGWFSQGQASPGKPDAGDGK